MGKKGTSLVELIAVIVIMGIIASISTVTVVNVIARQRENATIVSLNSIYETAKGLLITVETGSYDENITVVDDDFCYISITTMIDSGIIDGKDYKPVGPEIYFCYNMNISFVEITDSTVSENVPESTSNTVVNKLEVTFDFVKDKFKKA